MSSLKQVTSREHQAVVALVLRKGAKWSEIAQEVEIRRSAVALLAETGVPPDALFDSEDGATPLLSQAATLLEQWSGEGIRFSSLLDSDYPHQLLTIRERPLFVTWMGTQHKDDARGIAIVGSRSASDTGLDWARTLAAQCAGRGVTVVSGLAAGIDTAAHRGTLDAGGRTVAVIGTGLHHSYPKSNESLQSAIADAGMVLSQFLPDSPPTQHTFPMRNAIMSGFAAATVVVEAGSKSGARMQARLALQHGRRVFFLPPMGEQEWAIEMGRRPGALFVASVEEILEELDPKYSMDDNLIDA
jgi:DNA processing protein